jgi:di/tricarboxylate transporter
VSGDEWITAATLLGVLGLLASDRFPPAGIVLAGTVTLLVSGVITESQAFSGFANPAPITVATLYVIAKAADKTGVLAPLTGRLLGGKSHRGSLARLLIPAGGASAFLNNTPLVAMLIPDVVGWAQRNGAAASRYLLPLSYAVILGGVITVVGTSTNLIVSGLLQEAGQRPLAMFELAPVGAPVALAGFVVLLVGAPRLIPDRKSAPEQAQREIREFVVAMEIEEGGPLDGQTVTGGRLRDLSGLYLVEIERNGDVITPVTPDTRLKGGDQLNFVGRVDDIVDLQRIRGLRSPEHKHLLAVDSPHHTFYEAVVSRNSPLVGQTLKDVAFRARYRAAVVAIHRAGQRVDAKLGEVTLRHGDTLLILAGPDFHRNWREARDFLLIARLGGPPPSATLKAPIVGAVAVAIVALSAFDILPILQGALLGAGVLVATRTITINEARNAIDLDVVVLIGAAFGLGAALQTSGLATRIAEVVTDNLGTFGTVGIILGVVITTSALTELVTNNAAAVVMFPIAIAVAEPAGLDPRAIAIAVAVTASTSFLTPIGYQTNTMVYGPGGYRFTDYLRLGIPLNITVLTVVTIATARMA